MTTLAVAGSLCLAEPSSSWATEPIHPLVIETTRDIAAARGPTRYAKLRKLWSLWDDTDPQHVEQALRTVQQSPALDASTRAYASLLSAYARRRRGDLQSAKAEIAAQGFVDQWMVVGPFDNEGRSGLDRVFDPETRLDSPLDLQLAHQGKERPVRWRSVPDVYPYGWLDFGDLLRPEERICAYASTFVRSRDDKARAATVWLGATGAFRLFWNGEEVLSDGFYRVLDAERFATTVGVKAGWNRLTVKVCGDALPPMLTVRLGDRDGAPDRSLEASADPGHADAAAKNAARPAQPDQARVVVRAKGAEGSIRPANAPPLRDRDPGRVRGPIDQFEAMLRGPNGKPDVLEAYARYLIHTGGDDPVKHLARDFATRAAEKAPTVDRLLLASTLAEDRNQQRIWIDKAVKLAGDKPSMELLLAQAQLARSGPHWRDAVPFYDQALARDPDQVEALLGRVDLYNEAGLRRTALGMLEKAVERNPRAVGLLRVYALQLASLGRQSEAEQIGVRYTAYRFDDPTQHVSRLDLAVAQRNDALAQHWIDRLLAADPDSSHHLSVAARAYTAMGKQDKAIEAYQRALALAPEDTDALRELADLHGRLGQRDPQLRLLRQILTLRPQFKDVREYVEHIEPKQPRADEAYAWSPDRFLPLRSAPAEGFNQRTLRDLQVTTVYPSGLSSSFRQVVFQPLTEEAATAARDFAFAYQADRQVVQLRAGRVYRADGRIDETIETSEGPADNPAIAMYTSARIFYVQLPRLDVGDVVELRYRIEEVSADNVFADYFGEVQQLQSSEPVRNAEYVVIAPTSRKLLFGVTPLPGLEREERQQGDSRVYRFFAPSVRPILNEPNMPPWSEVLGHVHVSTYATWKDVGAWYWGLAKEQINPDDEVRRKALELTKGLKTDEEKVRAIYGWVVKRTRYVALEFGIYGYKPRRASQTLARGWGDCKDKATLIVSMLQVVGIPANIVIVRTALRGAFPNEPASLAPFDHAIAYVPSLDLYLDGTAEFTGSTELPPFDRGSMALVVHPEQSRLVTLPDPPASETERKKRVRATLRMDGSANVSIQHEASGAIAAQWRLRYHGESSLRDRIGADTAQSLPGFVLDPGNAGVESDDLEQIEQPVRLRVSGKTQSFARRQGDELSVPVTPPDRFVPRFASLSQRKLDILLSYRSTIDEAWTIELPAGAKVRELPKAHALSTPFGTLRLEVNHTGNTVSVTTRVGLDKRRIAPGEYAAFVKFCEEVDRALNQRLLVGR
jgi:tetratricopeptide (TPR) repeat protein